MLRTFSGAPLEVEQLPSPLSLVLGGQWAGLLAGGPRPAPTWGSNPQYMVSVAQRTQVGCQGASVSQSGGALGQLPHACVQCKQPRLAWARLGWAGLGVTICEDVSTVLVLHLLAALSLCAWVLKRASPTSSCPHPKGGDQRGAAGRAVCRAQARVCAGGFM